MTGTREETRDTTRRSTRRREEDKEAHRLRTEEAQSQVDSIMYLSMCKLISILTPPGSKLQRKMDSLAHLPIGLMVRFHF